MPSTLYDLADNYFQAELILRAATTNGGTTVITYTAKSGQSQEGQANYILILYFLLILNNF